MQRYFSSNLKDNNFILSNDDWYHINTVMRMKENDNIEIVYNNSLYLGRIENKQIYMIKKIMDKEISKRKYILCIPLLTDSKMSFVLQKATELGIDMIIPIYTKRSIVKINDKNHKLERWYKICKEASEQSKRLSIPVITDIKELKDLEGEGLKIVCSTTNKSITLKQVLNKCDTITFVVGPEGGFTNDEEELLVNKGFIPITLGENILRVETVPIYILSILKYEE